MRQIAHILGGHQGSGDFIEWCLDSEEIIFECQDKWFPLHLTDSLKPPKTYEQHWCDQIGCPKMDKVTLTKGDEDEMETNSVVTSA